MSYFIFGAFTSTKGSEVFEQIKQYADKKNILLWFGEEITFYKEIYTMINEQEAKGNIIFAMTSSKQPSNSSDLLFPFDKYSNDVLFADKSRDFFKLCCRNNISILFDCFRNMISLLQIKKMEIFVVEGYDDSFKKNVCHFDEFEQNILCQVEEKMCIESSIYYINI